MTRMKRAHRHTATPNGFVSEGDLNPGVLAQNE
jgi:hypothetical protein